MFDPQDRPSYDDTFGFYNEQHTRAGGPYVGRVTAVDYVNHKVDVYLPFFNQTAHGLRVGTTFSAGPNTGIHSLPPLGAEVQVISKNGKTATMGQLEIVHINFSGDSPPPDHPSIQGQKNFYAIQSKTGTEERVTPATIEFYDDKGGKHSLVMGKTTKHSQGAVDDRVKGLSITQAEDHALKASNGIALANQTASALDPTDMAGLAKGFQKMADQLGASSTAGYNAAITYGEQIGGQAEAMAIGKNAEAMASGNASYDSLI